MNRTAYTTAVLTVIALTGSVPGRSGPTRVSTESQALEIRQVALFKNGVGFFVGEVALPAGRTGLRFTLPAVPSHGTFWISYPPQVRPQNIVAHRVESEGPRREAVTIPEILKANIGNQVRLTIDKQVISGRITDFTQDRRPIRPLPYAPGLPQRGDERPAIWPIYQPGLVIIDVNGGQFCLDPHSIQHLMFPAGRAERQFADLRETVEVRLRLAEPTGGRTFTVSFLGKGITWAPSYLVDISAEAKARLSAKALVINEMYDLRHVTTHLVTGFPHVKFVDLFSPIGMRQSIEEFLGALMPGELQRMDIGRRILGMVPAAEAAFGYDALDVAPGYGAAEMGETAEDLFLYPAGRVTLAPDQVAYVPLFTEAVPYEHLYKWNIPSTMDETGRSLPPLRPPDGRPSEQEIWHSLRLENTTQVPWAAAPAQTVQGGMILGQDTLEHTPPGGEATLRITRALDVRAEPQEREIERTRGAIQVNRMQYDLVTVRGELSVTSFRREAITLEITKTLAGEVQSSDPDAKVEKLATGLQRLNPLARLTWTLNLQPGVRQEVTYVYRVYVHS
jgi:hypothetical protein